ncbi:MAG: DUF1292 domain-containing protein [Tuberibacillus sp.]
MAANTHEHEEEDRIIIPDENGEEHLFDVLFTFDVEETGKSYMVVKPVETSEDDEDDEYDEVFGFRYEETDDEFNLYPIETDEEWDMVEEMINTFAESDI